VAGSVQEESSNREFGGYRVSALVRKDGKLREVSGTVDMRTLQEYRTASSKLEAELVSCGAVDVKLPDAKVDLAEVPPLIADCEMEGESKLRMVGLHPRWGGLFKKSVRVLAFSLDMMTWFWGRTRSRELYSRFFLFLAGVFFVATVLGWLAFDMLYVFAPNVVPGVFRFWSWLRVGCPLFCFVMAWCFLFGCLRLQNGCSFMVMMRVYYDPIPAFEKGPVISIGGLLLSLKDVYTGMCAFGGIGSGKCWARGTRMLMYDGSVKCVEDIRVGDWVMGPDSKPRRVLSLARGRGPMYRISERGGAPGSGWGCNDVHLLTLKYAGGRPRACWRTTKKDSVRGRLPWFPGLYQVAGRDGFGCHRNGRPVVPQDVAEVELGRFLGRTPERDRSGYGMSRWWKMFRVPVDFGESDRSLLYSGEAYYGWGLLFGSGEEGVPAWSPDVYLCASRSKRMAFLSGVLDSRSSYVRTGGCEGGCYEVSIDGPLRDQVMMVARSAGFFCRETAGGFELHAGESGFGGLTVRRVSRGRSAASRRGSRGRRDPLSYDWKAEPVGDGDYYGFTLDGDGRLLLEDFTVVHNTAGFINPTLLQFFRKLNDPNPRSVYARWGGLVLDVKGDFVDFVLYCFKLVGRPLEDLVIIDPEIDLVRYNPLDTPDRKEFGARGADKLANVQRLLSGGGSDPKNRYWDDTSKSVIETFLQTMLVMRELSQISLADVARYSRSDDMTAALARDVEARLERDRWQLEEAEYYGYLDAVSRLRDVWMGLQGETKNILKTTIAGMLGPIAASSSLQRVFCRDTNFSFKSVITEGKVVLFRGNSLSKNLQVLISICLKQDFQMWAGLRNGSSAEKYGLAKDGCNRTALFVCDEYQDFVSTGGAGGGDGEFFAVSRSCKVCPIVATQHVTSLLSKIGNEHATELLLANLCTKIFLNTPDRRTGEMGEHLGAQYEREELGEHVDRGSLFGNNSQSRSTSVNKRLQHIFRRDMFANLLTVDIDKFRRRPWSRKNPWYSEAIVYHYNSYEDKEKVATKMFFTKLQHCYAPREYMAGLSMEYSRVLRDRNAQRQVEASMLGLAAHALDLRSKFREECNRNKVNADIVMRERRQELEIGREVTVDERLASLQSQLDDVEQRRPLMTAAERDASETEVRMLSLEANKVGIASLLAMSARNGDAVVDLEDVFFNGGIVENSLASDSSIENVKLSDQASELMQDLRDTFGLDDSDGGALERAMDEAGYGQDDDDVYDDESLPDDVWNSEAGAAGEAVGEEPASGPSGGADGDGGGKAGSGVLSGGSGGDVPSQGSGGDVPSQGGGVDSGSGVSGPSSGDDFVDEDIGDLLDGDFPDANEEGGGG
jgi:hypothetical protein